MKRPILYDYFLRSADELLAGYEKSKLQGAATNVGVNRELLCNTFLGRVLPPRLTLARGEIWDSRGNRTGQLETVVLRDDAASLMFGEADTYLAEGVFAVVEVKSNLTRAKLREALTTLKRVKSLHLAPPRASIQTGTDIGRPLRCVFAFEGATWDTLSQELFLPENEDVADLVCVLSRGVLVARRFASTRNAAFTRYHGRAPALAWLYYLLVSRSTRFLARSLKISPYFKPWDAWSDSGRNIGSAC